jgi:hypothetical protein
MTYQVNASSLVKVDSCKAPETGRHLPQSNAGRRSAGFFCSTGDDEPTRPLAVENSRDVERALIHVRGLMEVNRIVVERVGYGYEDDHQKQQLRRPLRFTA